jgi:hypothetical protein
LRVSKYPKQRFFKEFKEPPKTLFQTYLNGSFAAAVQTNKQTQRCRRRARATTDKHREEESNKKKKEKEKEKKISIYECKNQ